MTKITFPLTRLLAVAGLAISTVAFAQPAETPAAPAAPVVTADPAAKQALQDASDAIKNLPPITFKAKSTTGGAGLNIAGEVKVMLIRGKDGAGHSYRLEGNYAAPGLATDIGPDGKPGKTATVHGVNLLDKTFQWLQAKDEMATDKDGKESLLYKAKTLVERPLISGERGISKATLASETFKEVFLAAVPFAQELGAQTLTLDKPQTIGGEDCIVVKAMPSRTIERMIIISAIDKLPRRYEQHVLTSDGKRILSRTYEYSEFNMDKSFKTEDLKLALPKGYTLDRKTEADYPKPVVAQPAPKPAPAPAADPTAQRVSELSEQIASLRKELANGQFSDEEKAKRIGEISALEAELGKLGIKPERARKRAGGEKLTADDDSKKDADKHESDKKDPEKK